MKYTICILFAHNCGIHDCRLLFICKACLQFLRDAALADSADAGGELALPRQPEKKRGAASGEQKPKKPKTESQLNTVVPWSNC